MVWKALSRSSPKYHVTRADDSVIQGKVENIELPVKEVDIIISEWMVSLAFV